MGTIRDDVGQRLMIYWREQDLPVRNGVADGRIRLFERHYGVELPHDFRNYLLTVDGLNYAYSYGMISFWELERIKPVTAEIPGSTPTGAPVVQGSATVTFKDADKYFVFADFMHDMQLYAIRLSGNLQEPNDVIVIGRDSPLTVASSFSEFVDLYFQSPQSLYLSVD